ncbi:polyprenyl synthetase family protein [Streptomyces sp. NPDC006733]|uniref:polyprenyl synthetase family protein n=1 Tax=Streptomyces sp. NPDC006733 TaxID=3155460 RepID=UPI0033F1A521
MRRIANEYPSTGEQAPWASADGSAPCGCGTDPLDPAAVDADVAAAVGRVLGQELRERVFAAAAIDPVFAQDIAERVARFTLDGGKRTRSQFLWWGLRAAGGGRRAEQTHAALRIAGAVELLQTCALVHDDVMDGSALRRGLPAVHCALDAQYASPPSPGAAEPFGRAAAILAGDLALAWADDMVANTILPANAYRRVRGVWQAMRTEMVAGQYLDLHGQATGSRSAARALRTACLKSALYSVERPLALGAALAEADPATTQALCAAGRQTGIAFQLRDDLHGVFGDPAHTGKPSGEDIRDGKPTYLFAVARDRVEAAGDQRAARFLDASLGRADLSASDLDRVRDLLVATGAREAVEARIAQLADDSGQYLAGAPRIGPAARGRLLALFQQAAGTHPPAPQPAAGGPAAPGLQDAPLGGDR